LRQAAAQAQAARVSITQNVNTLTKANRPAANAAVKLAQWYIKRAAEDAAKKSGGNGIIYTPLAGFRPITLMWALLGVMVLQAAGVVNLGALADGIAAFVRHLTGG
jgi:hypothetical protein